MTPELKELQLEQLRDEIDRYRTVIVEAYEVRKWCGRDKINESCLEILIDLLDHNAGSRFNEQLSAEYRSAPNGFGRVIVKAYTKTKSSGKSWRQRNPKPRNKASSGETRLSPAFAKLVKNNNTNN